MGAKTFREATLGLIDEGALMEAAEEEFGRLQRAMVAYAAEWGQGAEKAKATLTIRVTVRFENAKDSLFSLKGEVAGKLPARPPQVTVAVAATGEGGEEVLMCRAAGTADDDPRQGRLFTRDGRRIDSENGKPVEAGPKPA